MKLHFTITDIDCLNFSERFYQRSPSHQSMKLRARLIFPAIMIGFILLFAVTGRLSIEIAIIYLGLSVAWFILYPKRFDARIRKYALKQMKEASYEKNFGDYDLTLADDGIHSNSPTGESRHKWQSIDDVELTENYLYIFLSGPSGYSISINQIGSTRADEAHRYIKARLN